EVPGDPVQARRHGDGDRGRPPPRLPRGVAEGPGPAVRARRLAREALHGRALAPRVQRGGADPRRLRLHGRVPGQPLLPRPEGARDRRGNERGAAEGHRPRPRPVSRAEGLEAAAAMLVLAACLGIAARILPPGGMRRTAEEAALIVVCATTALALLT